MPDPGLAELLIKRGVDVLLLKEKFAGKGPGYVLSNSDVDVAITDATAMGEALAQWGVVMEREENENNYAS